MKSVFIKAIIVSTVLAAFIYLAFVVSGGSFDCRVWEKETKDFFTGFFLSVTLSVFLGILMLGYLEGNNINTSDQSKPKKMSVHEQMFENWYDNQYGDWKK